MCFLIAIPILMQHTTAWDKSSWKFRCETVISAELQGCVFCVSPQMTHHMAGMNFYGANSVMGYGQPMGETSAPNSNHVLGSHVWKWKRLWVLKLEWEGLGWGRGLGHRNKLCRRMEWSLHTLFIKHSETGPWWRGNAVLENYKEESLPPPSSQPCSWLL